MVQCTRWVEIQETVHYHINLDGILQVPTVFRLLNRPARKHGQQQFGIAERGEDCIKQDVDSALNCIDGSFPGGGTPLMERITTIRENIVQFKSTLLEKGAKCVVVIATDGIPTVVVEINSFKPFER